MKANRLLSFVISAVTVGSVLSVTAFGGNNNNTTTAKAPTNADNAALYWAVKAGSNYDTGSAGAPIIVGDNIVSCTGSSLLKYNRYTGEALEQRGTLVSKSDYNIVPPLYADGKIFVGLRNGTIQAFDADTLESLWIYKDELKGQANSPIIYHDGCVYTGFWNSETKSANYVCVSVADEDTADTAEQKQPVWTYTQNGGFYWAGAYVCDNFLLVGTDDGDSGYDSNNSSLLSLNPKTGEVIDRIDNLCGDIRSSITFDGSTNACYFTSKGGRFYTATVNSDVYFNDDTKSIALANGNSPAICTSTPFVYNGRAYIGVAGTSQFTPYSGHNITVIDLPNWSIAYQVQTKGFPQASGVLTNGYEDSDGYVYVYYIDNYTPGQIRVIKDKPGVTAVVGPVTETYTNKGQTYTYSCAPVLFTPSGSQAQYAICTPVVDDEGTLYFKNDSAYLMAVGSRIESLEIAKQPDKTVYKVGESFDPAGMKVVANLANGLKRDVTDYITCYDSPLDTNSTDVQVCYNHVLYADKFDAQNGNTAGVEISPPEVYVDISVFTDDEMAQINDVIEKINAIGDVTLESEPAIVEARAAYDALSDEQKSAVTNYETLVLAEQELAELKNPAESKADEQESKTDKPDSTSSVTSTESAPDSVKSDKIVTAKSTATNDDSSPNTSGNSENIIMIVIILFSLAIIVTKAKSAKTE